MISIHWLWLIVPACFMLGVIFMYYFTVHVLVPHVGKKLQQTNMPKSVAVDTLISYHAHMRRIITAMRPYVVPEKFSALHESNNKLLGMLRVYIHDPKSVDIGAKNGEERKESI